MIRIVSLSYTLKSYLGFGLAEHVFLFSVRFILVALDLNFGMAVNFCPILLNISIND